MRKTSKHWKQMRRAACLLCVAPLFWCWINTIPVQVHANEGTRAMAIEGATLIGGTAGTPVSCAVILIERDRVRAAGKCGAVRIPVGTRIIDARGKFILPGLIDCHCHLEGVGLGDLGDLPEEWATPDKLRELILDDARLD